MNDDELSERTLRAFETIEDESSHLFYVHFFGPHQPLRPSAKRILKYQIDESQLNDGGIGFRQVKKMNATTETYKSMYDAVIEDTDERMGLIIDAFLEKFPNGRIVMTSDHGEMIGEHGELGHKDGLYQELIHVPLVVFGDEQQRIGSMFSLAAIADWITDSVGIETDWAAQWEPFSESTTEYPLVVSQRDGDVTLIRSDKTKLVMDYPMTVQNGHFFQGKPSIYMFNLSKDPKELRPLEMMNCKQKFRRNCKRGKKNANQV